jgi:hypothetical protein
MGYSPTSGPRPTPGELASDRSKARPGSMPRRPQPRPPADDRGRS